LKKFGFPLMFVVLLAVFGHAQTAVDQYGGVVGATSPNGGTGYFRVEKVNNRWLFVSPAGNYFWMRSVQSVAPYDGGTTETNAVTAKYPLGMFQWGDQTNRRLGDMGFNTLGEYTGRYAIPDGTYGAASGSSVPHPYIRLIKPSANSGDIRYPYHVKDLIFGLSSHYTGYRGQLPDMFDPAYAQCVTDNANADDNTLGLDASHYLIGTTSDDTDELFGFGGGPNPIDTSWRHPEIGWMVAITASRQTANAGGTITYADTTVYSKQAWVNFLAQKYGTIQALNSAWGSNYTAFGSSNGTGLLDEDGSHSWIGTDNFALTDTNPNTAADMRAFTGVFADKYFSLVATAIRAHTPHHLVFSPDAIGASARPGVFAAAAKWADVIQISSWYANPQVLVQQAYTNLNADKPLLAYMWTTACADSPYAGTCTQQGSLTDYSTQSLRGAGHSSLVNAVYNAVMPNGTQPVIGFDMWEWTDKEIGGERAPFGLVTVRDNVVDGQQNVIAAGTDPYGFATGNEVKNFGNFVSQVSQTNKQIDANVYAAVTGGAPVVTPSAPTVSFSSNITSIVAGQSATLSWTTQNATSVSITGISSTALAGSAAVVPAQTTTYTLTATGAGGTSQASVTITVTQATPVVTFTASAASITAGQSVTLNWATQNATGVSISGVTSTSLSGSATLTPSQTTTYTLTATGPGGTSQASVTVSVVQPAPVATLSANTTTIIVGQSVTLTWTTKNATKASLGTSSVALSGSTVVKPTKTTTYTLTATGAGGSAQSSARVTVKARKK
jgi:hypothetical protein